VVLAVAAAVVVAGAMAVAVVCKIITVTNKKIF
jgi:hypothetical protein